LLNTVTAIKSLPEPIVWIINAVIKKTMTYSGTTNGRNKRIEIAPKIQPPSKIRTACPFLEGGSGRTPGGIAKNPIVLQPHNLAMKEWPYS
jgi:hypothetical protein